MVDDDAINMGWPAFLLNKSAAAIPHGFRTSWRSPMPTVSRHAFARTAA